MTKFNSNVVETQQENALLEIQLLLQNKIGNSAYLLVKDVREQSVSEH